MNGLRRTVAVAMTLIVGAVACGDDGSESTTATTAIGTTVIPASTAGPATSLIAPGSTPPSTGTTPRSAPIATAGPGGGSGEVTVRWQAVADAAGYRVQQSTSAGGPFETVADLNVFTGVTTAAVGVINIWTSQHTYLPAGTALAAPDSSTSFELIEVDGQGERCFRVAAYNADGRGPESVAVCASPP